MVMNLDAKMHNTQGPTNVGSAQKKQNFAVLENQFIKQTLEQQENRTRMDHMGQGSNLINSQAASNLRKIGGSHSHQTTKLSNQINPSQMLSGSLDSALHYQQYTNAVDRRKMPGNPETSSFKNSHHSHANSVNQAPNAAPDSKRNSTSLRNTHTKIGYVEQMGAYSNVQPMQNTNTQAMEMYRAVTNPGVYVTPPQNQNRVM